MAPPDFFPAGPRCNCLIVFGKPCPFGSTLFVSPGSCRGKGGSWAPYHIVVGDPIQGRHTVPMRCVARINAAKANVSSDHRPEDFRSGGKGRRDSSVHH
jgi:hypothetical protein